jgi:hypothetical protein
MSPAFFCPVFFGKSPSRTFSWNSKEKNMKKNRLIQLMAGLFLLLSWCSWGLAQDVSYNFDQQADFSKYKTYKWVAAKDDQQLDELNAKLLISAIEKQLTLKGLTKTEGENADLYVRYQFATSSEKQMTTFDTGYGMGPGWRGYGYGGGGMSTSTTSTIRIGAVAVDMYDSAKKQLVWRGIASKQIDMKAKPDKREKNLNKGMEKMFKNFPPPVKK